MYTTHAVQRCSQRAISHSLCSLIMNFGESKYDGHGAKIWFITKESINRIKNDLDKKTSLMLDKKRNAYVVESLDSNSVITVGYAYKKNKSIGRVQ